MTERKIQKYGGKRNTDNLTDLTIDRDVIGTHKMIRKSSYQIFAETKLLVLKSRILLSVIVFPVTDYVDKLT